MLGILPGYGGNSEYSFLRCQYAREKIYPNYRKLTEQEEAARIKLNVDKEQRHILGTHDYKERIKKQQPSYITISTDELSDIIQKKAVKSKAYDGYQFIDAEKPVGVYIDRYSVNHGKTTRLQLKHSNAGSHAVPVPSWEMLKNGKNMDSSSSGN